MDALLYVAMGNCWRNDAMDARRLAAASAGTGEVPAAGVGRLGTQGDLAEIGAGQQGLLPEPVEHHKWT